MSSLTHQEALVALFSDKALRVVHDLDNHYMIQKDGDYILYLKSYTKEQMTEAGLSIDERHYVGEKDDLYWFEEDYHFDLMQELAQMAVTETTMYTVVDRFIYSPKNLDCMSVLRLLSEDKAIIFDMIEAGLEERYLLLQMVDGFLKFFSSPDKTDWKPIDSLDYLDIYDHADQVYASDRIEV